MAQVAPGYGGMNLVSWAFTEARTGGAWPPPGTIRPSTIWRYLESLQKWEVDVALAKRKWAKKQEEKRAAEREAKKEAAREAREDRIKERREARQARREERQQRRQERREKRKERREKRRDDDGGHGDDGGRRDRDHGGHDRRSRDHGGHDRRSRDRGHDRRSRRRARGGVYAPLRLARGGVVESGPAGGRHTYTGRGIGPMVSAYAHSSDAERAGMSMSEVVHELQQIRDAVERVPSGVREGVNHNMEHGLATRRAGSRMTDRINDRTSRGGPHLPRR